MKYILLLALVMTSTTTFAGSCRLSFSSEAGILPLREALKESHLRVTSDECSRFAVEKLGHTVYIEHPFRAGMYLITHAKWEYTDSRISASGSTGLKKY